MKLARHTVFSVQNICFFVLLVKCVFVLCNYVEVLLVPIIVATAVSVCYI
jgi:hypothetical protein